MYDRRAIFLRAHQLRRLNGNKATLSWALSYAWSEAKGGTLPSFTPAAIKAREIDAVERTIRFIEARDRLYDRDYRQLDALRSQLSQIAA